MENLSRIKTKKLRFGDRVEVIDPTSFYAGLVGKVVEEYLHEPLYRLVLEEDPNLIVWVYKDQLSVI